MADLALSIVIPAFNEESRIQATLYKILTFLETRSYSWEIIVSDDGSTDSTASRVKDISARDQRVRLISLTHKGKGWAVRKGMLAATGQYRFLCDADLSMPIEHIERFWSKEVSTADIVLGSREMQQSRRYGEPQSRVLMGRIFNLIVRLFAVHGFRDTQCGFKCFSSDRAFDLFNLQNINGFAFDVEILYLAKKHSLLVEEVHIDWFFSSESKVRPVIDALVMTWDLMRIRWTHRKGRKLKTINSKI